MDEPPAWLYLLAFKSKGKGQQRLPVSKERVEDVRRNQVLLDRPDVDDKSDTDRRTQTHLEQFNTNRQFREVADFFATATYLHLVPQLLKYADQLGGHRMEDEPFGTSFLERIAT